MFDRSKEYEANIRPLLEQASQLCSIYQIPFFASCCVKDNGEKSTYKNMLNGAVSSGVRLTNDHISKHINVANGFDTVPRSNSMGFESYDEITDELGG